MEQTSNNPEPNKETVQAKAPSKKTPNKFSVQLKKFIHTKTFMVLVLIILACAPAAYFYHRSQQAEKLLKDPNTANQQVINEVVKKVSRHILLPTGEQPTLASVTDVNKVKGQPFFANAQNGDKVLVYTQARKAFLYRPDKDIIIEVAPLNIGQL